MWVYNFVSRQEFERKKDFVQAVMSDFGAEEVEINLPYKSKTTTVSSEFKETFISERPIFKYNDEYFRVDEVLFGKPFIVLEYGNLEDVLRDTMIDADPFPYDLPDEEIRSEVKWLLGV